MLLDSIKACLSIAILDFANVIPQHLVY